MRMKIAALCMLCVSTGGAGVLLAYEAGQQSAITSQQLLVESLAGEDGKEVNVQVYTFPPHTVLPWHIHRDAHEIAYVLHGTLTFHRAGQQPEKIEAGEAEYLQPNIVHRGMNEGDEPVKLFVVRIKPKDAPLAEDVPPPQ